ncbi:MAG: DNA-directed RNA polymerase subunit alpha C-terminal domain-containing protein [Planctomycetota bacterium]
MAEGTETTLDVRSLITDDETERAALVELRRKACSDNDLRAELKELTDELGDESAELRQSMSDSKANLKRGISFWLLGRPRPAIEALDASISTADSNFFLALCHLELADTRRAQEHADKVLSSDPSDSGAMLLAAEARIKQADLEEASELLDQAAGDEGRAGEVAYLRGLAADIAGEYEKADEAYSRALDAPPVAPKAKFRLAYNANLAGDEATAIQLYEELLQEDASYVGALINLGILYEDKSRYQEAAECFERVLKVRPADPRAQLYYRQAVASFDTIVDDDLQKEVQRRVEILQIPISDFELSVRSRNCLSKMNIRTLGDLVQKTEQELLSYKNFGETSLAEIEDVLNSKNLRLGMFEEENMDEVTRRVLAATRKAEEEASKDVLKHGIDELELSVRARRCLDTLGIRTIGDLTEKTQDELLAARNFGRTSLQEIRDKLGELDLALADDSLDEEE